MKKSVSSFVMFILFIIVYDVDFVFKQKSVPYLIRPINNVVSILKLIPKFQITNIINLNLLNKTY
jgi:hypothetical protein